ncbi:MAG: ABC transporter permease [Methylophilaceae bacterium]
MGNLLISVTFLLLSNQNSMKQTKAVINPHAAHPTSFILMVKRIWHNRQLISQMIKREILGRYKGSILGLTWSFFYPVLMLIVYTFVFSVILKSRWGGDESKTLFAILIFTGMIVLNFFSEVINRSPSLILSNVNYVKKVVFPIEVLPVVIIGAALFHALVSFVVLLVAFVIFNGFLNWTIIFIPLVMIPLVLFTLGFSWFLASLGVFLRDLSQAVGVLTMVLMFLSPVFYPVSAIPKNYQQYIMANPLTFIIEQAREVVVYGHTPNWSGLILSIVASTLVLWLGYIFFQKYRKGFADVL